MHLNRSFLKAEEKSLGFEVKRLGALKNEAWYIYLRIINSISEENSKE